MLFLDNADPSSGQRPGQQTACLAKLAARLAGAFSWLGVVLAPRRVHPRKLRPSRWPPSKKNGIYDGNPQCALDFMDTALQIGNAGRRWLKVAAAITVAGSLTDCATQVVEGPPPRQITCRAGPDCDAKWTRAVSWIVSNSHSKIQTQTDILIQTFNPEISTALGFTATKVASSNGLYEITLTAGCRTT
jgi:hypothetical protein